MTAAHQSEHKPARVLATALSSTRAKLDLTQSELGAILGLDRTSVARIEKRGNLDPSSKEGELALLLIRVYRSLYALLGGNQSAIYHWLHTENTHLHGSPLLRMKQIQGLVEVVQYLDAIRGKL